MSSLKSVRFLIFGLLLSKAPLALGGGWTGGGGDGVVLEFVSKFYQVNRLIGSMPDVQQKEVLETVTVHDLFNKIRSAELRSQRRVEWNGVEKDAINIIELNRIVISRSRWPQLGDVEKAMLSFHEVMGLLDLDRNYDLSQRLEPLVRLHGIKKILPYSWDCLIANEAPFGASWLWDSLPFSSYHEFLPRIMIFNLTRNGTLETGDIQIAKRDGSPPDFFTLPPVTALRSDYYNSTSNGDVLEGQWFSASSFDNSGSEPNHESYGFTTLEAGDAGRASIEVMYRDHSNQNQPSVWTSPMKCERIDFLNH